jgi:hypothetical protein
MFMPTGRLSAIEKDGEKVQIQTEFGLYPKPRVTTTVILGGQVLHKQQKVWEAETESEGGQRELEVFLNKQHIDIHNRVESDELLISKISVGQASTSDAAMPGMQPVSPAQAKPARHPAAETPGIVRMFIVSKSGDLIAADDTGVPRASGTELFLAVSDFIEFWEEVDSDRFAAMHTQGRDDNYILVRHFGKYWGAEIVRDANPPETMKLFVEALET